MATIERRTNSDGKTSYRIKVRLKGCSTQSATFDRLTDARRWAQQTEAAIREGRHFRTAEAKRHTLAELIDRYVRDVLPAKPKSFKDRKQQLDWWKEQLGYCLLADLTPSLLSLHRDKLFKGFTSKGKPRTPATVVRYLAALSHAFTIAVKEWQWLEHNPLAKVSKPKEPRGRVRFLSEEERERLLNACKESSNPYLYIAVVLALSTGGGRMEILSLRWPQVDLQRGVIVLHETKNGDRRVLPLAGHALKLMQEHAGIRRIDTDLIFPGHNSKQPIDLRAPWESALQAADITDFRWHDLRHSCASYLAMNGATLAEIAEVLVPIPQDSDHLG